jgi:hypothetical protein
MSSTQSLLQTNEELQWGALAEIGSIEDELRCTFVHRHALPIKCMPAQTRFIVVDTCRPHLPLFFSNANAISRVQPHILLALHSSLADGQGGGIARAQPERRIFSIRWPVIERIIYTPRSSSFLRTVPVVPHCG